MRLKPHGGGFVSFVDSGGLFGILGLRGQPCRETPGFALKGFL